MAASGFFRIFAIGTLLLSASVAKCGEVSTSKLIPGFYDPKTQTFTATVDPPSPSAAPSAAAPVAPRVVNGTLAVKAIITLEASIPAGAQFRSQGYVNGGSTYAAAPAGTAKSGTAIAFAPVQRSGSTATATMNIPYHMLIDSTTLSVTVYFSSDVAGKPSLKFDKTIPVPANGSTTAISFPGAL